MNYSRYFKQICNSIEKACCDSKKIVLCPFGQIGVFAKYILNTRYGIKEYGIIDNKMSNYNEQVYNVCEFANNDDGESVIIITATVDSVATNLINQLKNEGVRSKIISIKDYDVWEETKRENYYFRLKQCMHCKKVEGYNLVRVGANYDGGYVLCDDFDSSYKVYSFGIGENDSWDKEMAARGMEVYMYDHTIKFLPEYDRRFHFNRIGVSDSDDIDNLLLSLETIMKKNGDLNNKSLILKMDIEGAEWGTLKSISSELLNNFRQITLELHDFIDNKNVCEADVVSVISKLNKTHQIVWIHGNNNGYCIRCNDMIIPSLLEVTFLNRNIYSFSDNGYCEFPLEIDSPNLREKRDIVLGKW